MDILPVVVGIVVIVLGILVSIALHEVGHMVPAKKFGVRVSEYMVGFGPTLWSRTKGETEYGLKAIPLGGYVRLVGMMPPAPAGSRPRDGFFARVVADARDASVSEIRPGEEHRAFYHLSTPKKLVVMLGGPVMNLVIAVVLLAVVFLGIGMPAATTTVADVGEDSAAAAAGVRPGDEVVSFDGVPVEEWSQLVGMVNDRAGEDVPLTVLRDGEEVTLQVTPTPAERPLTDDEGYAVTGDDGEPVMVDGALLGVSSSVERQPLPASSVPEAVWMQVSGTAHAIATLPVRIYDAAYQAFTDEPRAQDSVMSVVGVGRVAVDAAGAEDYTVLARMQLMLMLLAALNIALFMFNLIPLLPLDGGHVVNALYEGARRTVARVRGATLPGPADVAKMMPVAYVVFVVLVGVGAVLMVADLVDPVRLL
ncbi:RIP metalloprotease RseP [Isoptericola sp. CG 20/1183]|uniref:RIP metalloprotease RseP n=1 Tax=Isoptericola halotolerans TaxID=300560 RepID=A0ABX5ECT8_9MICO|nr:MULTISPECIES: site-2 protease family protein [Isoptericola]PRZ05656.1 RIP metalloprotease RseP [Isoptericola halotolerans]PRZ06224.1 RIP metalloprotease RseP [Isoptericola sp. CG 20/1183]